jgi:transcriptional regulator with XRE-family HTH domain
MFNPKTIEVLINKKGWTKYKLAKEAGIGHSTLAEIISGKKKNPSINTLEKISSALEVSLSYLSGASLSAIVEDRLSELSMTVKELSEKTRIPENFIERLNDLIPEGMMDYEEWLPKMDRISKALDLEPGILRTALARQEIPMYDDEEPRLTPEEAFADESVETVYKTENFTDPKDAVKFILSQPSFMAYGGYDLDEMSDEEILEIANDMVFAIKISLERMKNKKTR